jgi:cell division septal protein FtsQ
LAPNRKRSFRKDASAKQRDGLEKGKKTLGAVLRLLIVAIFSSGIVWVAVAAYRHVTTNEYFAVRDFDIVGLDRLGAPEILKTAGLFEGQNIFHIDVEHVKKNLLEHPWILDAKIQRRLPRSIKIEVVERHVEAMALFDVPYLVDDTGAVFKRWVRGDPTKSPIISGFTREQFLNDREVVEETIRDAIDLARRYNSLGVSKAAPLCEIHYEVNGDFSLTLEGDDTYVRFGAGPYRTKLNRLAALLGRLRREGQSPEVIFFDNDIRPDRAMVRLKSEPKPGVETGEIFDSTKKRMSKI